MADEREAVYDCKAEERGEIPCGECIVCLGTLLDERTRDLEAAHREVKTVRLLMQMHGDARWNERMGAWVSGRDYRDGSGRVIASTFAHHEELHVAVAGAWGQWVAAGRPPVRPLDGEALTRVNNEIDEHYIRGAAEVNERRSKEASGG